MVAVERLRVISIGGSGHGGSETKIAAARDGGEARSATDGAQITAEVSIATPRVRRRAATLRNITATDATQSGRAPRETARVLQLDEKTPEAVAMKAHGEEQRAGASSFYPAVLVLATSSAPCSPDSESPLAFPARGNTVRAITIRL
jgi:hypothetical protein